MSWDLTEERTALCENVWAQSEDTTKSGTVSFGGWDKVMKSLMKEEQ